MKLYSLLYEQKTNYLSGPFALAVSNDKQKFVLYDTSKSLDNFVAAYIKVKFDKINCPSAAQIAQSARGDSYPGAGEALYKIVSAFLGVPITSDRTMSTSQKAQNMWNKIETSPEMQHYSLDNWIWNSDYETKTFVKNIDKSRGTFKTSPKPATPSPEDDCVLPGDPVDGVDDVRDRLEKLGTPNAHKASVEISNLVKNHENFIADQKIDTGAIIAKGEKLFNSQILIEE